VFPLETNRFSSPYSKIVNESEAILTIQKWQQSGLTIVMTDAVLDIPHYRHADYFMVCANYGDKLLVRINSDEFVAQRKDPRGPIIKWNERAKAAAHYPYIDLITTKTVGGWQYLDTFKPNIVIKSVTSGIEVLNEIDQILPIVNESNIKLIVLDEFALPISRENIHNEGLLYTNNKLGRDKFSGSIIKNEIKRRTLEDLQKQK
jgi:glycerol-3-phosphate cytidylyltransferase-like family protein